MSVTLRRLIAPSACSALMVASIAAFACSPALAQQRPAPPPANDSQTLLITAPATQQTAQPSDDTLAAQQSPDGESLTWWDGTIRSPLGYAPEAQAVAVEDLLIRALQYSARIQVASDIPLIREQAITVADAAFDWRTFVDTRWDDLSDPVGNQLTTGGPPRYRSETWSTAAGVRRRNTVGGEFEVSQRLGYQNTNSVFFVPKYQGNTRLTLSYTQPLLRGAGRMYNTSLTVLATIDTDIGMDEFSRQLQERLLEITRAYWSLYVERGAYFQKKRLYERAAQIQTELEHRSSLGTLKSQLVRARAAVEARKSDLLRAELAIKNAESKLRALVNDPRLGDAVTMELVPMELPALEPMATDMSASVTMALRSRPEVLQAMREVQASSVRLNVAKNELLPMLNVVLMTYAAGLQGDFDIGQAWLDQFSVGEPGYGVGLQYEFPIWNRAAQARHRQRLLEMRQLESSFRETAERIKAEVEIAVRDLDTSYREIAMKRSALEARRSAVDYLYERWKALPEDESSTGLLLENLLDAQDRLAAAEFEYLASAVSLSLAHMTYKRATGILLQAEQISLARLCEGGVPSNVMNKLAQRIEAQQQAAPPPSLPTLDLETLPLNPNPNPPQPPNLTPPASAPTAPPAAPAPRAAQAPQPTALPTRRAVR
ncbi:MAG: TolC family protein [Pirellulales bacterium]